MDEHILVSEQDTVYIEGDCEYINYWLAIDDSRIVIGGSKVCMDFINCQGEV